MWKKKKNEKLSRDEEGWKRVTSTTRRTLPPSPTRYPRECIFLGMRNFPSRRGRRFAERSREQQQKNNIFMVRVTDLIFSDEKKRAKENKGGSPSLG